MDEELYTRNTGGPREGMHASNKAESSGAHSEKLRADSSRSQSMKGKYRNGKKSGEGGKKLKKSGEGKQGGKRFGFKPPIPTPPPPGTVNFTGNEHAEDNNASEDIRDNIGTAGILGIAGYQYIDAHRPKATYVEPTHDWSNIKEGRHVTEAEMEAIRQVRPGGIPKATESTSSNTQHHTQYYTRYCEPKHDWSNVREGKKLTPEQMEQLSQNHGFHTTAEAQPEATPTHKTYYTKYRAPEHDYSQVKEGYSKKIHDSTRFTKEVSEVSPEGEGYTSYEYHSNPNSRQWQKRSTQKEIMRRGTQAKAANTAGDFFSSVGQKLEALAQKMSEAVMTFARNNPIALIIGGASCIGVISASTAFPAMGMMFSGANNVVVASSFTAEDEAIVAVEEDYQDLEDALRDQIDDIEEDYPGYDEYNYNLASITHDPFELAALLTVLYEDYTEDEVQNELKTILNGQYDLILNPRTETRTRTVTKWHWVTKTREVEKIGFRWEGGRLVSYTYTDTEDYTVYESYEEEEEYEYKILDITLTRQSIGSYVLQRGLSDDQLGRYQLLMETKGNKPDVFD